MIELRNVTKRYGRFPGRRRAALERLTLSADPGECLGLVGPNGAGKSTLLGVALGFLRPDQGLVLVNGTEPRRYVRREGIGYVPEVPTLPRRWRVRETLLRLGILDGLAGRDLRRSVDAALERVGLIRHAAERVPGLSKGSVQRLAIAQLLLRPRRLILLDEPYSGLDPFWRASFRELLGELRRAVPERTVILASHDLQEVARVADRVAVLAAGSMRGTIGLPVAGARSLEAAVRAAVGTRIRAMESR
jgi:ABC-type multidrug transport system ATPase subunit